MKKTVAITIFILITSLPFLLMLFSSKQKTMQDSSDMKLLIISPHRREVKLEYSRAFKEWLQENNKPYIEIVWLDVGGTSKMLKDLESRFNNSDFPDVDIMFGGGVDPFIRSKSAGWLQPANISQQILSEIPDECAGFPVYDKEMYWFGVALSGFGIVYNNPLIDQLGLTTPKSWEDLTTPEFFTWVASGDPRSSGSVHMCYEIILQAYGYEKGWEIITKLCANIRKFGEGGGEGPREVASGEVVAGLAIDQYAETAIKSVGNNALGFSLPDNATVVNPDAIAILKNAPNKDSAEMFLNFVLSFDGQKILCQPIGQDGQMNNLYRMPVNKNIYTKDWAPKANPYDFKSNFKYNTDIASKRWNVLNSMMGTTLIDPHKNLQKAWKTIIDQNLPEEKLKILYAPPVSEEELLQIAESWSDNRYKLEITTQWAQNAQKKYKSLAEK
ncbi:MAG: extracellular solute-binding protein [Kiritimatiellae bacterium]|jgi:iron(III) transport system substrate-binding protein|nr:extracellular solute-binding protein [Kiritimatiellia bacterium]